MKLNPLWYVIAALAVFATLAVAFVGVLRFGDRPLSGVRVERLEADLEARLPIGSTWGEAEDWFASHSIRPGHIAELKSGEVIGLMATVPNRGLFDSAVIVIEMHFDEKARLKEKSIRRFVH